MVDLSWLSGIYCVVVWSAVAVYQQSQEAGYLAVMALEASIGFAIYVGKLVVMIGFVDGHIIPSTTVASFILLLIGSISHLGQRSNLLTAPFTRPLIFLGTFFYFIGLMIISSRLYSAVRRKKSPLFWFLQVIAFVSGFAAILLGPLLELPFLQVIGGTMFVLWLLLKYIEIMPWNNTLPIVISLLGFGILLYLLAHFMKMNPQYLIFHAYSSAS